MIKAKFSRVISTLVLLALSACASSPPPAQPVYYTSSAGARLEELSMTSPRANHSATRLSDGRVLICGGTSNNLIGSVLASAELYDPATHTFARTGDMTVARMGQTTTLLRDGRVLIVGGQKNVGYRSQLASAELYDPATGTFTATGSMSTPREGHTATLLRDGRVLVAGGSSNGVATLGSAEVYDPSAGSWTRVGHMTVPRDAAVAVLLGSGKVLIAGGGRGDRPGGYIAYQNAELFDPATRTFTAVASQMTSDRIGASAVLLQDGRALIMGGKSGKMFAGRPHSISAFTSLATTEVYDPELNSFTATAPMRTAHYLATATVLNNGDVLLVGGWTQYGPVVGGMKNSEVYWTSHNFWSDVGPLHTARLVNTETLLDDGQVLIAGGMNRSGVVVATVEFYVPKEHRFERRPVEPSAWVPPPATE